MKRKLSFLMFNMKKNQLQVSNLPAGAAVCVPRSRWVSIIVAKLFLCQVLQERMNLLKPKSLTEPSAFTGLLLFLNSHDHETFLTFGWTCVAVSSRTVWMFRPPSKQTKTCRIFIPASKHSGLRACALGHSPVHGAAGCFHATGLWKWLAFAAKGAASSEYSVWLLVDVWFRRARRAAAAAGGGA